MQSTNPPASRAQTVGNVLIYLCGIGLIVSSTLKFAHLPPVVAQMASMGFEGGKLTLVAALEGLSALLFLFKGTRFVGLLLMSSFLGGAICAHVAKNQFLQVLPPSIFLSLLWIGVASRYPQVLGSLSQHTDSDQLVHRGQRVPVSQT